MIEIKDKHDCCGCEACVNACPKSCIDLLYDNEGFMYPSIRVDSCINCNKCVKACPVINKPNKTETPIETLSAINNDEGIRISSSSGGIFSLLAEWTIERGGVVFGAVFDEEWNVKHDYTNTKEDLFRFRGSKYVQSRICTAYKDAEKFLKQGIYVFFTGTSCQIAGLKRFLNKEYENLLTADCLCHGVPSPKVWNSYIKEITGDLNDIENISFRDKRTGWKKYSFTITLKDGNKITHPAYDDIYMKGFLSDLYLRPSCERCPTKSGRCRSDITLADCWGIDRFNPHMDDDNGTGLILVNSVKGQNIIHSLNCKTAIIPIAEARKYNGGFKEIIIPHKKRSFFFKNLSTKSTTKLITECTSLTISENLINRISLFKTKIKRYL